MEDRSDPEKDSGRISWIQRFRVRNHYESGDASRPYGLDVVSHKNYDAIGVLPYWETDDGVMVMLLKTFRPALHFRELEPEESPFLVEIIAGVLEQGEHTPEGVLHRACEEMKEEAGLLTDERQIRLLGAPFYSSPGVYTEKLWIATAKVDPDRRCEPTLDGSVMEELLEPFSCSLQQAVTMCRRGEIRDAKTEIAIARLSWDLKDGAQS